MIQNYNLFRDKVSQLFNNLFDIFNSLKLCLIRKRKFEIALYFVDF